VNEKTLNPDDGVSSENVRDGIIERAEFWLGVESCLLKYRAGQVEVALVRAIRKTGTKSIPQGRDRTELMLELRRQPPVIRVENRDPSSLRQLDAAVPCSAYPPILLVDIANSVPVRPKPLCGIVRGAVVNDDELVVFVRLRQRGLDGVDQETLRLNVGMTTDTFGDIRP
jgi:hypothetical protein